MMTADLPSRQKLAPKRIISLSEDISLVHQFIHQKEESGGTWVAQSVKCTTSAQVMISRYVSSSPASGSVLTARSLEPALNSVSPSLSAPSPAHTLSLSVSQK